MTSDVIIGETNLTLQVTLSGQSKNVQLGKLSGPVVAQIAQFAQQALNAQTQAQQTADSIAGAALIPGVVATFSALPLNPKGLWVVQSDETKGNNTILYLFYGSHRAWVAMIQEI